MEEISKKKLLAQTGISNGKLYRWKRRGLIPEEWFIKRSVSTGQETFFPRELILARINAIVTMQNDRSLEGIKEELSGEISVTYNLRSVLPKLTGMSVSFVEKLNVSRGLGRLDIESLATVIAFYETAHTLYAGWRETQQQQTEQQQARVQRALEKLLPVLQSFTSKPAALVVIKGESDLHFIVLSSDAQIDMVTDSNSETVHIVYVAAVVERLREKLATIESDEGVKVAEAL